MMLAAVIEAMASAGCSPEQIAAVARAVQSETDRLAQERRANDAARKRKSRGVSVPVQMCTLSEMSQDVTGCHSDICDPLSQGSLSPTPPIFPNSIPFNPPKENPLKGVKENPPNGGDRTLFAEPEPVHATSPVAKQKTKPKPKPSVAAPMPDRWHDGPEAYNVFEDMVAKGDADWPEFDRLMAEFADYHAARGSRFVSWAAALRTWVRNDRKFRSRQATHSFDRQEFKRH